MTFPHRRGRPRKSEGRTTRADILHIATRLAAQGQLRMRTVAQLADVQVGTIYAHYGSRAGLVGAVLDAVGPGIVIRLSAELQSPDDLPAFCAALACAWASPLSRVAYRAYRLSGGLPQNGNLQEVRADLRREVWQALRALERRVSLWGVPQPQQLAWDIVHPLLAQRETDLSELEKIQAALKHGERLRLSLQGKR